VVLVDARWATLHPAPIGTGVMFDKERAAVQAHSAGDGLSLINDAAYNLVVKGVTILPRLFRAPEDGGVDPNKTLTGPIGIFREMKNRAQLMGFDHSSKLLHWSASICLSSTCCRYRSLMVASLLMLGVETVIRRPLPMWLRNGLMWLGIVIVGLLFVYICGLDILRLIGIA